jgi:hypothetical protein
MATLACDVRRPRSQQTAAACAGLAGCRLTV